MSIVDDILDNNQPSYWIDVDYKNMTKKRFALCNVQPHTSEYAVVSNRFESKKRLFVTKIQRIQHPYAYASFKVNYVYYNKPKTVLNFIEASKNLWEYIDCNCDERCFEGAIAGAYIQIKRIVGDFEESSGALWYPMYYIESSNIFAQMGNLSLY